MKRRGFLGSLFAGVGAVSIPTPPVKVERSVEEIAGELMDAIKSPVNEGGPHGGVGSWTPGGNFAVSSWSIGTAGNWNAGIKHD